MDVKKCFSEGKNYRPPPGGDKGVSVKDLCPRHGYFEGSYFLWQNKFGSMDGSDAKCLKALEDENALQNRLLAESMHEKEVTRESLRK